MTDNTPIGYRGDDEPRGGLMVALLEVQRERDTLKLAPDEQGQVGTRKYKYLSLARLMDAVVPLLTKHGLVWMTSPCRDDTGEPALAYRIAHAASGEAEQGVMPLMLTARDPQGQGSAITYARRYSLLSVLGLVADEDDDGKGGGKGADHVFVPDKNGEPQVPKFASESDVREMVEASKGLAPPQVKLALTAAGVSGVTVWNKVPADKVVAVIGALGRSEREVVS